MDTQSTVTLTSLDVTRTRHLSQETTRHQAQMSLDYLTADLPRRQIDPDQKFLLAQGQQFGCYRIEQALGKGGMGEVYEAVEDGSGRRLALKVLNRRLASEREHQRFIREGRLAAKISHPNSVYVFGTQEIEGIPVIAMESLPGGTLLDVVRSKGPMPVVVAIDAILQVIEGLEAAREQGILHRDVKPSNCLIDSEGVVKIADYGLSISTAPQEVTDLTVAGTFLGTPAFASPEQLQAKELDLRSDIYSVGATLYFLLTGQAPFDAANLAQMVATVVQEQPVPPARIRPEIPHPLSAIVLRCLEKSPAQRYPDYRKLMDDLVPFSSVAPNWPLSARRFWAYVLDWLLGGLMIADQVPAPPSREGREIADSCPIEAAVRLTKTRAKGSILAVPRLATRGTWHGPRRKGKSHLV